MSTRRAWAEFLYQNYDAVAVNPTKPMRLLDVLIKTGHEGTVHRLPRIENVGSMLKLGQEDGRFAKATSRLSAGLKCFEEKSVGAEGDESLFSLVENGLNIIETSSSAASSWVGAAFGKVVDAHLSFKGAQTLTCNLLNVKIKSVNQDELLGILANGQWLPDTDKRRLKWPQPGCTWFGNSGRELWVVHDILCADKVIVDVTSTSDGSARVTAPAPAVGMDVDAGFEVSTTTAGSFVFTSKQGAIMFGFRAVRVQYNLDGSVVRNVESTAGHCAYTRMLHRPLPPNNPKLHMAGLFKDVAVAGEEDGDGAEGDGMQVLDIVDAAELELSEQDSTP